MINLTFVTGAGLRRVSIDGRIIKFLSGETGFQPIEFDLDKILSKDKSTLKAMKKVKLTKQDMKHLKELSLLRNEDDMADDIIKDFQKTGWRLTNRE